jgi:hypothetical protein
LRQTMARRFPRHRLIHPRHSLWLTVVTTVCTSTRIHLEISSRSKEPMERFDSLQMLDHPGPRSIREPLFSIRSRIQPRAPMALQRRTLRDDRRFTIELQMNFLRTLHDRIID